MSGRGWSTRARRTIDADPDAPAKAAPEQATGREAPDEKKPTENAFNIIQGYDYIEEGHSNIDHRRVQRQSRRRTS